jgi:glucose-6-phosphate 1-epimerase
MDSDLHSLNEQFSIPEHLSFHEAPGGMAAAVVNNRFASALITLAGAHVMSYRPHGGREVLWTSPSAAWEMSNAMRGGIPVCWPWFALHPIDPNGLPIHGVVRTQLFQVLETRVLSSGATLLRLSARDAAQTRELWPHAYQLEVAITVGESLTVEWTARNPGHTGYDYTGALHPYFAVSNVHDLTLRGLEGLDYLDSNDGMKRKTQSDPVTFPAGIDNVYLDTAAEMVIEDPGFQRTLRLRKSGSRTSVVWNPYTDDAASADVGAGQHRIFVCAEAANAAQDIITVQPGDTASLSLEIIVEKWSSS